MAGTFFLTALWLGVNRSPSNGVRKSVIEQREEAFQEWLAVNPLDRVALVRLLRNDARRAARWLDIASKAMDGEEKVGRTIPWLKMTALRLFSNYRLCC